MRMWGPEGDPNERGGRVCRPAYQRGTGPAIGTQLAPNAPIYGGTA